MAPFSGAGVGKLLKRPGGERANPPLLTPLASPASPRRSCENRTPPPSPQGNLPKHCHGLGLLPIPCPPLSHAPHVMLTKQRGSSTFRGMWRGMNGEAASAKKEQSKRCVRWRHRHLTLISSKWRVHVATWGAPITKILSALRGSQNFVQTRAYVHRNWPTTMIV